jgi:hypothetical protein
MSTPADHLLRIDSQEVVWREIGDELVVLHMGTATYLTINGSGRTLWNRLADGATPSQLADALIERYGIDAEQARLDVQAFVESLVACTLLSPPS